MEDLYSYKIPRMSIYTFVIHKRIIYHPLDTKCIQHPYRVIVPHIKDFFTKISHMSLRVVPFTPI